MILVLGHVAHVHRTANSPFVPFTGTNPGSAPNFSVARHPPVIGALLILLCSEQFREALTSEVWP